MNAMCHLLISVTSIIACDLNIKYRSNGIFVVVSIVVHFKFHIQGFSIKQLHIENGCSCDTITPNIYKSRVKDLPFLVLVTYYPDHDDRLCW